MKEKLMNERKWEKERKRLIKLIRTKRILYNNSFILIKSENLLQLSRADFIPCVSTEMYEAQIEFMKKGEYVPPIIPIEFIPLDRF